MLHQKKLATDSNPSSFSAESADKLAAASIATGANAATSPQITRESSGGVPDLIAPWEWPVLLEHVAGHVDVLSLDCFDTLLLRKTRTPIDVFYDLQNSEAFRSIGMSAKNRVQAESRARSLQRARKNRGEVTLHEIYSAGYPHLSTEQLEALSHAELQAELDACYVLEATGQAILHAKRLGLDVQIVSDTYFTEEQLRTLLSHCLSEEAMDAIGRVYVSSAYGHSKSDGLFDYVLEDLKTKPNRILHVGDNLHADYAAARRAGIAGIQLRTEQPIVQEQLRMWSSVASLLVPEVRRSQSLSSVYHGFLASQQQSEDGASVLGYLGMGPLLYGFGRFIEAEIERLEQEGRRVKPLFLMRDGYLPQQVFESICPEREATAVSVSRFVAYGVSFTSEAAIDDYLARSAGSMNVEAMMKQLLLPEKTCKLIRSRLKKTSKPGREFIKQVKRPEVIEGIVSASADFRRRFYRYLERLVEMQEGDTLLFVDLGYEGTAQRCLGPILKEERGVEVFGCYLMAASVPDWRKDRRGVLDADYCDERALASLIHYVALIEDLCTARIGSVVDYGEDGDPIAGDKIIGEAQYERIQPVQEECVRFAREASRYFEANSATPSLEELRLATLGSIARLLFLPNQAEVDYLDGFRLDMGMGTLDSFALFDRQQGLEGLRKRGLFFMETDKASLRMNYPVELRHAGLEHSIALLAQHRYGSEFSQSDLTQRRLTMSVMVLSGADGSVNQIEAQATYDGYYSMLIPVGDCAFDLGLLFGQSFEMIQLHSVDLIPQEELMATDEAKASLSLLDELKWERSQPLPGGVVSVPSTESFAFLSARPHRRGTTPFVIRVVFRPLAQRGSANDNAAEPGVG